MSNTGNKILDGSQFDNVSIIPICGSGGSLEASGTIYTDNIKSYNINNGVNIEQSLFQGGTAIITSTSPAINSTTGSLIVNGGIYVNNDSIINGILSLSNTTNSNNTSTGSLLLNGGVSIQKNLNIGGVFELYNVVSSTITQGALLSLGGITILNSTNAFSISSGGGLTNLGGLSVSRDVYIGGLTNMYNVLNMNNQVITNVTSPSNALDVANKYYVDNRTAGTLSGNFSQGQVIIAGTGGNVLGYSNLIYNGAILSLLSTINSSNLITGALIISGGVAIQKNVFANGIDNNGQLITNVTSPSNLLDVANKYYVDNLISSLNSNGQVNFNNTTDATNATTGGALTVLGGTGIAKKLYVGTQLYVNNINMSPSLGDIFYEQSFNALNNISSPTNITGFNFNNSIVRYFNGIASCSIITSPTTGNLYDGYELKGIQVNSGWKLHSTFIGDNSQIITFSITNTGQVQYISKNISGFVSNLIKFRAFTTSVV